MNRAIALCLVLGFVAACGVSGTSRGDLILPQASSAAKELVHEVVDVLKVCAALGTQTGMRARVRAALKLVRHIDTSHADTSTIVKASRRSRLHAYTIRSSVRLFAEGLRIKLSDRVVGTTPIPASRSFTPCIAAALLF